MSQTIYLACPYTHKDSEVVKERETVAAKSTAALVYLTGACVFSPITHGHRVADYLPEELRLNSSFWMAQTIPILRKCDLLLILNLDGWKQSRGVAEEIQVAHSAHIPTFLINAFELMAEHKYAEYRTSSGSNFYKELSNISNFIFSSDGLRGNRENLYNQIFGGGNTRKVRFHGPDEQGD